MKLHRAFPPFVSERPCWGGGAESALALSPSTAAPFQHSTSAGSTSLMTFSGATRMWLLAPFLAALAFAPRGELTGFLFPMVKASTLLRAGQCRALQRRDLITSDLICPDFKIQFIDLCTPAHAHMHTQHATAMLCLIFVSFFYFCSCG